MPSDLSRHTPSPERQRNHARGHTAEYIAAAWLMAKGYRILVRRLSTPLGEVDIVAVRGRRVVFAEVKARRTFPDCEAAITPTLSTRVRRAAALWLGRNPRYQAHEQGYDLVFIVPRRLPRHITNGL